MRAGHLPWTCLLQRVWLINSLLPQLTVHSHIADVTFELQLEFNRCGDLQAPLPLVWQFDMLICTCALQTVTPINPGMDFLQAVPLELFQQNLPLPSPHMQAVGFMSRVSLAATGGIFVNTCLPTLISPIKCPSKLSKVFRCVLSLLAEC